MQILLTFIVVQARLETDNPSLQLIEYKMYVGSVRFIVGCYKLVVVEYKISDVAASCRM